MTVALADRLAAGNQKRIRGAAEWRALIGAPRPVIEAALMNPSEALACKRISTLFGATTAKRPGVVPKIGRTRLRRAMLKVAAQNPHRRRLWGTDIRLDHLTISERRELIAAVIEQAPKWWRDGEAEPSCSTQPERNAA